MRRDGERPLHHDWHGLLSLLPIRRVPPPSLPRRPRGRRACPADSRVLCRYAAVGGSVVDPVAVDFAVRRRVPEYMSEGASGTRSRRAMMPERCLFGLMVTEGIALARGLRRHGRRIRNQPPKATPRPAGVCDHQQISVSESVVIWCDAETAWRRCMVSKCGLARQLRQLRTHACGWCSRGQRRGRNSNQRRSREWRDRRASRCCTGQHVGVCWSGRGGWIDERRRNSGFRGRG